MSGVEIYFTCVTFSPLSRRDVDILTRAAVGVPVHGRMCVGVLAIFKNRASLRDECQGGRMHVFTFAVRRTV